ncbi:iron-sulfur cluster assembly scaffold protein [Ensifer sp. BR816]|uniref:iron-sulfur cluster assembly scaffold protein n=1 Tax=Rhizobium sp. (strain BR816) TaxID=1057002 RepID=UPI00352888AC
MNAGVVATEAGTISFGNTIELMTRVDPVAEAITGAISEPLRCSSAIASSSVIAERIIGTAADEAHHLVHRAARFIDSLSQQRMHRSAMRFIARGKFRGVGRVRDRERGTLICGGPSVHEGVIRRTSVSTDSRPTSKTLATRSQVAAGSRAPMPWKKGFSGAAKRQCTPKASRRESRSLRKTRAAVDAANSAYRKAAVGVRSPEGCGGCNLVDVR